MWTIGVSFSSKHWKALSELRLKQNPLLGFSYKFVFTIGSLPIQHLLAPMGLKYSVFPNQFSSELSPGSLATPMFERFYTK